jgi:hypothetical protein
LEAALPFESSPNNQIKPGKLSSESGFLLPAVQALAIQCISLIILYVLLRTAWSMLGLQATVIVAALLQGCIAAALSYWRRLPKWWLLIQFCFPIALQTAYSLDLPPGIFLGAFLLLLILYWTPFKTRVPLYLSGPAVWEKLVALLPKDAPVNFIDIGSGLGGLALDLAKRCPNVAITGIELAPFPWFISCLRGRVARSRAHFILGNYQKIDFSQFDVVFAYLSPAAMNSLWEKANLEMRPGTLLLSYEFTIPEIKPDIVIQPETNGSELFGWRISNISQK